MLENDCLSQSSNLSTVCEHIGCRSQVFPSKCAEFPATTSNGIISNTKDLACNFYFFSQVYIKFRTFFFKKDESPSLSISQIIDSERGGYLNF